MYKVKVGDKTLEAENTMDLAVAVKKDAMKKHWGKTRNDKQTQSQ